jgi:hypothetical protein
MLAGNMPARAGNMPALSLIDLSVAFSPRPQLDLKGEREHSARWSRYIAGSLKRNGPLMPLSI